jgi:hypothetical protein
MTTLQEHEARLVNVEVDVQPNDLYYAHNAYYFSSWEGRTITGVAIIVLTSWLLGLPLPSGIDVIARMAALFALIAPVIGFVMTRIKCSRLQDFQRNHQVTFSSTGYHVRNGKSSSMMDWASIKKVWEHKHCFLLIPNVQVVH